jgi:hypothetical protein
MDYDQFMKQASDEAGDHPEAVRRKAEDSNVKAGLTPELSWEKVNGRVDLSDTESKGRLAAAMGRYQRGDGPRSVDPEKGSKSIYAQDKEDTEQKIGKQ